MYRVGIGFGIKIPEESEERGEYYLEQMREYLRLNKTDTDEYKQVEIIFNAMLNIVTETNTRILYEMLKTTSSKLNCMHGRSGMYWSEFLNYYHWKTTGRNRLDV